VNAIRELFTDYGNNLDKNSATIVTDLYRALDEIVTRIYFVQGYSRRERAKNNSPASSKEYYVRSNQSFYTS
jgi:hypothetical protein